MNKMIIETGTPYPIYFRQSYKDLAEVMPKAGKICIITDSNVAPLYLQAVKETLKTDLSFVIEAGESNKNLDTLAGLYKYFLASRLDRQSILVALGGGVVGDIVGFAAATYMRGIDFIQLPTTLLAQVDASVGGKTAVDFEGVKNLIGAFHQPKMVYMNLATLTTLPQEEFISGMGEVVKHGLIGEANYYEYLFANREDIKNLQNEAMLQVVSGSCRIKAAVVAQDERESGPREVLNFGHCVGHAIESLSDYSLPHGQCVSIGMCAALKLSALPQGEIDRAVNLMKYFDLPTSWAEYNSEEILATMYKDKKTLNDTLRIVLLKKTGEAVTDNTQSRKKILEILNESN